MDYTPVPNNPAISHEEKRTWRPFPLRAPFLLGFATLCILLCVGIELIVRACAATGCHVFGASSATNLSTTTNFVYNLLPTIISLVVSLLWVTAHHDVMRLEPYFQMSKPGGASAAKSLFLKYPYVFTPFLPFAALKRRHYVVLLSSIVLLLMNFFITPLIAGIFDDTTLTKFVPGNATRATLTPGVGSSGDMSVEFTYLAYDYAWLGAPLPPFTTPTFALLPVLNGTGMSNETWRTETTLYQAEMQCDSAASTDVMYAEDTGTKIQVKASDAYGGYQHVLCDQYVLLPVMVETNPEPINGCTNYTSFVTNWTSFAERTNTGGGGTSDSGSYIYVYIWMSGPDPIWESTPGAHPVPQNVTAIFCKASYYSEPVTATIGMPAGEVISVNRTGHRTPFTDLYSILEAIGGYDRSFKVPSEYISSASQYLLGIGYLPNQLPSVDSQLRRRFGTRPVRLEEYFPYEIYSDVSDMKSNVYLSNRFGLPGMTLSNQSVLEDLLDPQRLADAYNSALQLQFALAVSIGMVDTKTTEPMAIMRELRTRGFAVNMLWARGAQGGLAAVVLITVILAILIGRRPCELDGEPNSMAAVLRLLSMSPELNGELENAEFHSPHDILRVMRGGGDKRYKLELVGGQGPRVLVVGVPETEKLLRGERWKKRVWALRALSGMGFLVCFAVVVGLLVAAFVYARRNSGLPTLAPTNSFGYKVVYSYLPLAVGMAIEPVLILLGSYHCMFGPYKPLLRGRRSLSPKSLAVDFDKSPPHFQLLRALDTGNTALAALTVAILLSNVLSVAFSGIFSATATEFRIGVSVLKSDNATVNATFEVPAQEMYYILSGQLSGDVASPRWITPEYYVLPFYAASNDSVHEYEGPTVGIGIDVECLLVPEEKMAKACTDYDTGEILQCTGIGERYVIGVDDPCWPYSIPAVDWDISQENYSWTGWSNGGIIASTNCSGTMFPLWMAAPGSTYPETVILNCTSVERVVELTATINQQQQVVNITSIRPLNASEQTLYYSNSSHHLPSDFINIIIEGITAGVDLSNIAPQWINHLMTVIEPSTVSPPPNGTFVPNSDRLAETFADLYRRLFAINLQLYAEDIITAAELQPASGTATMRMDRVFVSNTMFYIAVVILSYMIVVLVVLYFWNSQYDVGHVPESLATMYSQLYASNAKEECHRVSGNNPKERAQRLEELEKEYTHGLIPGTEHFGVLRVEEGITVIQADVKNKE